MNTPLEQTSQTPSFLSREWLQIVILLVPVIVIAAFWSQIPDRIPTHWGLDGEVNGWMEKTPAVLLLFGINFFLTGLFYALAFAGETPEQTQVLAKHLRTIRLGVSAFISILTLSELAVGTYPNFPSETLIMVMVFLLLGFLGSAIRDVPPNGFIGVRIPKTLNNPENWSRTHALTGKAMMIAAAICIPLALLIPISWSVGLIILYCIGLFVFSAMTSFRIAKEIGQP